MKLMAATVSKPGGKGAWQDATGCRAQEESIGCWVVADGQGGGGVPAQQAVKTLLSTFSDNPAVSPVILAKVFDWAQRDLLNLQTLHLSGKAMRASAALFCTGGRSALWAHVGNVRVYVFRNGEVVAQTKDHNPAQALGAPGKLPLAIWEGRFILQPGDLFLLCTDGFWGHVSTVEMQIDWCKSTTVDEWLEHMEVRLLRKAPADHDSYSAIAIWVEA